jgi:transcriptional regulator with XRE-family HTH domain
MHSIREVRKHQGLDQLQFSKCMGVSRQTISNWECGRNTSKDMESRLISFIKKNGIEDEFPLDGAKKNENSVVPRRVIGEMMIKAEGILARSELDRLTAESIIDSLKKYL